MNVRVGTSGFAYKAWKGAFYPEKIKDAEMLRFYAARFPTVEVNNTFYRMPSPEVMARWAGEVPEGFRFVLKTPQRITHRRRLADVGEDVAFLLDTAGALGPKLGPLLVQLPPYMKKDVDRLHAFLALLPRTPCAAFEFRHPSWADPEVEAVLREHDAALCLADTDEAPVTEPRATASWGYLRLRRAEYGEAELAAWAGRVRAAGWNEAWVFFKHEDEARGPAFARTFQELLARS